MKIKLLLSVLLCSLLMGGLAPAISRGDADKRVNLLYLNSYENGYGWSDTILEGIKAAIAQSKRKFHLQIEYMDTKIRYDQTVKEHLFELYAHRYRNTHFDIIIVSDNNGFDFYLQYQNKLFPDVPAIFCGVNNFSPQSIIGLDHVTGIVESFDFKLNLELAQKFHPERKRFMVIRDDSTTAIAISSQIEKAFDKMEVRPKYEFLEAINLDQLTYDAKAIAPDTVFYFIPFYMDHKGGRYTANEIANTLWKKTGAPIYSNWKFLMGSGVVGGNMISGFDHGAEAARVAIRVLDGESPSTIPIIKPNDESYIFDNQVMDKFKIYSDELPNGSTLINRSAYFFEIERQVFWFLVVSVVLVTITLVFLMFNISERKAAESKLKDQLAFVRQLMNTIPIPIYFCGERGKFTGVNLAFEKWFNLNREQILGSEDKLLKEMGPGQLVDGIDGSLQRKIGIKAYEKRIRLNGQVVRDVILHKASYTNTKDEILGIVGAIHDITKRKVTEQELLESKQMLQLVLDNIPQHVHWKDKDLKYIGANRSFGNFFGLYDLRMIAGKTDREVIPDPAIAELSMQTDRQVVEQGVASYHMKWTMQRSGDEKVWLKVNRAPLHDQAGKVVGVLSTAEDITKNVLLQNKLVETTKMEAIGTLAGGIAHDFNNILTSIINSTELAMEDVPVDTLASADLRRSLKAARRGSRLVKQILTFTRVDKEGFQPTQIAEVVEEAVGLIQASLPRNIDIRAHIAREMALCQADPTQIHQVVMNLCTNAFQALKNQGGVLTVNLKKTDVDIGKAQLLGIPPGQYLLLSVSDNGPGIPVDIQDKIFDPFFTTKAQGEGTGLGLAVVHGIVNGHNGAICVTSTPGEQTVFEFFLPMLTASSAASPPKDPTVYNGDETILFVEDDEDQLTLIPRVLSQLGYRVSAHAGGREACERIADPHARFDLVITDYDMPEMNGLQLAEKIAQHDPKIPVIIVTGRKAPDGMREQKNVNIKRLIRKPYNKAIISRAIREVLDVN